MHDSASAGTRASASPERPRDPLLVVVRRRLAVRGLVVVLGLLALSGRDGACERGGQRNHTDPLGGNKHLRHVWPRRLHTELTRVLRGPLAPAPTPRRRCLLNRRLILRGTADPAPPRPDRLPYPICCALCQRHPPPRIHARERRQSTRQRRLVVLPVDSQVVVVALGRGARPHVLGDLVPAVGPVRVDGLQEQQLLVRSPPGVVDGHCQVVHHAERMRDLVRENLHAHCARRGGSTARGIGREKPLKAALRSAPPRSQARARRALTQEAVDAQVQVGTFVAADVAEAGQVPLTVCADKDEAPSSRGFGLLRGAEEGTSRSTLRD